MIVLRSERSRRPQRLAVLAGDRISKKYRRAHERKLRLIEYRRLRDVIPALDQQQDVTKIDVVQAAVNYIDELHMALAERFNLFPGLQERPANCQQLMDAVHRMVVEPFLARQQQQQQVHDKLTSMPSVSLPASHRISQSPPSHQLHRPRVSAASHDSTFTALRNNMLSQQQQLDYSSHQQQQLHRHQHHKLSSALWY